MTSNGSNRSDVDNHNNNAGTKLTPEQQEAVLFWPLIAHMPIIPCDSQSKQVHVKEWQKMNLDKVDYKQNLQKGLYDNGIAIRLGEDCLSVFEKDLKAVMDCSYNCSRIQNQVP
jgi:hypothetical protein